MKTKKLLVAFNQAKPTIKSSDFLLPVLVDGQPKFLGLSSGEHYEYGMVVMIGREITVNDIFAKVVDLGEKIDSVDEMLITIGNYFELLKKFKISNVLKCIEGGSGEFGFDFEQINFKRSAKKRLP